MPKNQLWEQQEPNGSRHVTPEKVVLLMSLPPTGHDSMNKTFSNKWFWIVCTFCVHLRVFLAYGRTTSSNLCWNAARQPIKFRFSKLLLQLRNKVKIHIPEVSMVGCADDTILLVNAKKETITLLQTDLTTGDLATHKKNIFFHSLPCFPFLSSCPSFLPQSTSTQCLPELACQHAMHK